MEKGGVCVSDELPTLLTLDELRERLKVSRATVFRLKKKGLPVVKVGGALRFDPAQVERWLREQNAAPGFKGE